jgi:hypothetical protein
VRDWIEAVLLDVDASVTVIFEEQRAPRPDFPYAAVMFLSDINRGGSPEFKATDDELVPGGKFRTELSEHRLGTFSVMIYGESPTPKAMEKALERSLFDPERYDELLADHGINVLRSISGGAFTFLSHQIGVEQVVTSDYEYAWRETTEGEVYVIETVDATANVI